MARQKWGMEIALAGEEERIRSCAAENGLDLSGISIYPASGVIEMCDDPGEIIKSKKDCSMAEGLRRVAAGEGDALVSAGSTGALVMGSTFLVKRIGGVKRAALAVAVPTPKDPYLLIDSGANVECRPEMLQSFGIMGSVYMGAGDGNSLSPRRTAQCRYGGIQGRGASTRGLRPAEECGAEFYR